MTDDDVLVIETCECNYWWKNSCMEKLWTSLVLLNERSEHDWLKYLILRLNVYYLIKPKRVNRYLKNLEIKFFTPILTMYEFFSVIFRFKIATTNKNTVPRTDE